VTSAITVSTPLIDWHALWQVLYISAGTSLGLVLLFTIGVHALSSFQHKDSVVLVRGANVVVASVSAAGILAMIIWGFYYIVNK
jgi:hypothetical protein